MPRLVDIRLLATETATGTFNRVERAARGLIGTLSGFRPSTIDGFSRAIDSSGRLGPHLDRVSDSAKISTRSLQEMGLALGAVGAGLAQAGQIAMTHERLVVSVEQAYKNAADEMLRFSDTLATETGNLFNDTDILAGERYFATLYTNYQVSAQQIQQLMRTTADLAAAAGISFENAAYRVTAAIRGEAEAAEYLGLTMNQQSIDRDNLTLKMTNQEAAQFRINALMEQAAWSTGAAGAIAETSAGQWARLVNRFRDAGQAVGEFIGPYGAMIAGLGSAAVGLSQFAGGFTALAAGIRVATTASIAFAASPLGLALTAIGGVAALATIAFLDHRREVQETAQAWEDAEAAAGTLADQIRKISLIDWNLGNWATDLKSDFDAEFAWMQTWLQDTLMKSFGTGDWFDQMVMEQLGPAAIVQEGELQSRWESVAQEIINGMIPTEEDRQKFYKAIGDILSLEGVIGETHFDAIQGQVQRLFDAFNAADGAITVEEFVTQLENLYSANLEAAQSIELTTIATNNLAAIQQQWADLGAGSIGAMTEEMQQYEQATQSVTLSQQELLELEQKRNEARVKEEKGRQDAAAEWEEERQSRVDQEREDHEARVKQYEEVQAAERAYTLAQAEEEQARHDERQQRREEDQAEWEALVEERKAAAAELLQTFNEVAGIEDPVSRWNFAGLASEASLVADHVLDAATSLETVFRVVVENTNAIGQQTQAVADWAEELINVEGEMGLIDEAYQRWIESGMNAAAAQRQFNDAQEAANQIFASNAAIQEHIQDIQIRQAPLVAEHTAALERQLGVIADMPADVQLTALAWMDAETSAKAFEVQALIAAAAAGEMGEKGKDNITKMVEGLIAFDPALEALLVDMGRISVGMDEFGNKVVTINFEGAESTNQVLQELTESLRLLTDVLDDGVINGSIEIEDNATPKVNAAWDYLDSVNGATSTMYVEGDDSDAQDAIGAAIAALRNADGDNANVTITADDHASSKIALVQASLAGLPTQRHIEIISSYRTVGQVPRGVGPRVYLGGVAGYASGGVVELAENGMEILRYANGGTVPVFDRGVYGPIPQGTYVQPNHAISNYMGGMRFGPFIFQGGSREEMNRWAYEDFFPMIERKMDEWERGQGVQR